MHFVYIIKSIRTGRYYIGETADLEQRLNIHNDPLSNKGSTKSGIPWQYYLTLECTDRTVGRKIERHIKNMKSTKYLENLYNYPEMRQRLLEKYTTSSS